MIERLLRRHRTARLLRFGAAILLAIAVFHLPEMVPRTVLPALVLLIFALGLVVHEVASPWCWPTESGMPISASLRHYGDRLDVVRDIDAEIAAGGEVRTFGDCDGRRFWSPPPVVIFTPSWLVQVNVAGVSAVRLDDVLWVFKRTRVVGGLWGRETVTHAVRVYFRLDQWEVLSLASPEAVDEVLEELLRRRPEILTGFFDDLRASALIGSMTAEIDGRRAELRGIFADRLAPWRAFQRRELNEATQHLALRDQDPFGPAGRTAAPPTLPKPALCLRRVIAAEWRRFGWQLFGLLVFTAITAAYICFFLSFPNPLTGLAPGGLMLCCFIGVLISSVMRFCRSFLWGLRRQLRAFGGLPEVVARIDAEMADDRSTWSVGTGRCTRSFVRGTLLTGHIFPPQPSFLALSANWLIEVRPRQATVVHLPDLVWVWKRVVPKKVWFGGSQYNFELGCRLADGSERLVGTESEELLDELAERLLERRPALLTGWRGDWHALREQGDGALSREYDRRAGLQAALADEQIDARLDESWDLYQRFVEHAE
jgi:hypothetical protein